MFKPLAMVKGNIDYLASCLPEYTQEFNEMKKNGEYELAMIPLEGWDKIEFVKTSGLHPEADRCETINAIATAYKGRRFITLLLMSRSSFSKKQLQSIGGY